MPTRAVIRRARAEPPLVRGRRAGSKRHRPRAPSHDRVRPFAGSGSHPLPDSFRSAAQDSGLTSVHTRSSVEGTSGAVNRARFRERGHETALKDNPRASAGRRADSSASAAPLPQRRLCEALQASTAYRSATGGVRAHQVGVYPSGRAVAFDGRCVSIERNPWAENSRSARPARTSSRLIGEEFSPPLRSRSGSSTGVLVVRICCRSR